MIPCAVSSLLFIKLFINNSLAMSSYGGRTRFVSTLSQVEANAKDHFPDLELERALYQYVIKYGVQGIFVSNEHGDRFIREDGIFLTASLCLVTLVCGEDCTIAKHSLSRHSIPRLGFPAVTAYTDFGRVSDEHRTSIRRASDEVFSLPSQLFLHLPLVRTAVYFTKIKFTPEGRASVVYLPVSDSYRDPKTMSSSLYSSVVYTKSFCTFRFALRAFVNVPFLYST